MMRKYGLVLLLLAAFAVLGALQTALLTQVGTASLDWEYDQIVMDTDSTLCLYKSFYPNNAMNYIEMKRIRANGLVENTGVIYQFPYDPLGDTSRYYLHYTHQEGPSLHCIYSNNRRLVYLQLTGSSVTYHYLTYQEGGINGFSGYPVFRADTVYFIGYSWDNQTKLWAWNYPTGSLESVYTFAPTTYGEIACPLGEDKILLSQWNINTSNPENYPVVIIDSQHNAIPTSYNNMLFKTFYEFEQDRYYVEWYYDEYANTYSNCGILEFSSNSISLETWSSIDSWAELGEGWRFLFPFGDHLHACSYTYSNMSGTYNYARIFEQSASGDIDLVDGFPQVSEPDKMFRFLGNYRARLLTVHFAGGEDYFRLADTNTQEWINVAGSPWQGADEDYYSIKYLCSDRYIFVHGRSGVNNPSIYSCLSLEIATSAEDGLQTDAPALSVYPNPSSGEITIDFVQIAGQKTELEIYNIRGQKVDTIELEALRTGEQRINYNFYRRGEQKKAPGIYFLRQRQGESQVIRKLVLL